jgi:electron transport complex protein RnfG
MAGKKESNFINMLLALGMVTFFASAALGVVYEFTKKPIAISKEKKKNEAMVEVVGKFNNNPVNEMYTTEIPGSKPLECYPAKFNNKIVGVAIKTYSDKGYTKTQPIELMVGFLPSGKINKIAVIAQKETPGLGDKIERKKSKWSAQFDGKNPIEFHLKVKKDGGDVDAITSATISSRAYTEAVEKAWQAYIKGGKK